MIGHAGPVYGVSFSHDNQYLISCSEDQTGIYALLTTNKTTILIHALVRLWSLDTFTNLVCYKSHNYPIWDVDFGPYGFYFATASHDKTARLWSCDHVNPLRIFAGHLSDVNVSNNLKKKTWFNIHLVGCQISSQFKICSDSVK